MSFASDAFLSSSSSFDGVADVRVLLPDPALISTKELTISSASGFVGTTIGAGDDGTSLGGGSLDGFGTSSSD